MVGKRLRSGSDGKDEADEADEDEDPGRGETADRPSEANLKGAKG